MPRPRKPQICDCGRPATKRFHQDWECDHCRALRIASYNEAGKRLAMAGKGAS